VALNAAAKQALARREEVARLLAARSHTHREIGSLVGVSRETVGRWSREPATAAMIEEFRRRPSANPEPGAVAVLRGLLLSEDERVRLQAATQLLALKIERIPTLPADESEIDVPAGHKLYAIVPDDA